jgi:hypothetical protein
MESYVITLTEHEAMYGLPRSSDLPKNTNAKKPG